MHSTVYLYDLPGSLSNFISPPRACPHGRYPVRATPFLKTGFSLRGMLRIAITALAMPSTCKSPACKSSVPSALAEQGLCILHFTLSLEHACSDMRRETVLGNAPQDRQKEIIGFIGEDGQGVAPRDTNGHPRADDSEDRVPH